MFVKFSKTFESIRRGKLLWPRKGSLMKTQTRILDNRLYYTRNIDLHRKGKKVSYCSYNTYIELPPGSEISVLITMRRVHYSKMSKIPTTEMNKKLSPNETVILICNDTLQKYTGNDLLSWLKLHQNCPWNLTRKYITTILIMWGDWILRTSNERMPCRLRL